MKELAEFIRQGTSFAVISHVSPDGDTMGSAAALLLALEKMGKKGQWFCEGGVPEDFMKVEEIARLVCPEKPKHFDSVICVDISSEDRMGSCLQLFKSIPRTAQIDHHITNTNFAGVNVMHPRNAAAFMMLELMDELGVELDEHIARALFVGIATDTGRLSHAGVTAEDVADTARLYAFPIRQEEIIAALFQTTTMKRTRLKGRAIEHLKSAFDGTVSYTYLDAADYAEFDADSSDSEGVIEMCRGIEGTKIALFIREVPNGYKASLRCLPAYDVAAICTSFGGGGHKLAAGCTIEGGRDDILNKLLQAIGEVLAWKA